MNDIITLDILAVRIAEKTGITTEQARQYITLIKEIATRRLAGPFHTATIPHVGTFTVADTDNPTIIYNPEPSISETVNEPFSFFEPVPLCDDTIIDPSVESIQADNDSDITTIPTTEIPNAGDTDTGIRKDTSDNKPEPTVKDPVTAVCDIDNVHTADVSTGRIQTYEDTQQSEYDTGHTDNENNQNQTDPVQEVQIRTVYIPDEYQSDQTATDTNYLNDETQTEQPIYDHPMEYDDRHSRGMNSIVAYILGILTGMILTCIAVFFLYPPMHSSDDDTYTPEELETSDAASEDLTDILTGNDNATTEESADIQIQNKTRVSDAVTDLQAEQNKTKDTVSNSARTDTVGRNYYLATMSRKYYGRMDFWVYIYKENQSKLGHPDRIPVGTVVTIPPASKYDITPESQASVEQARRIAAEIKEQYR